MYRNYDGAGSRFGDVSVSAASTDQGQLAIYGAQRRCDGALTLMVLNKTGTELTSPPSIAGAAGKGTAQRFTYSPANLSSIVRGADLAVNRGSVTERPTRRTPSLCWCYPTAGADDVTGQERAADAAR